MPPTNGLRTARDRGVGVSAYLQANIEYSESTRRNTLSIAPYRDEENRRYASKVSRVGI